MTRWQDASRSPDRGSTLAFPAPSAVCYGVSDSPAQYTRFEDSCDSCCCSDHGPRYTIRTRERGCFQLSHSPAFTIGRRVKSPVGGLRAFCQVSASEEGASDYSVKWHACYRYVCYCRSG
jgi:hypothetical protein